MALTKKVTQETVVEFGKNGKDTGSIEVQIALITKKITRLTEHLKANDKDCIARRSLLILVGQRRSLLKYLEKNNRNSYIEILAKLGLRK